MNREAKAIVVSVILLGLSALLQSTLLQVVAIRGVRPDLTLVVLIFVAVRRGPMTGQLAGFGLGMVEDFISLAPLGFHTLLRCVTGFLYGLLLGSVFVDPLLVPVILAVSGTLLKGFLGAAVGALFRIPETGAGFVLFTGPLWMELLYNAVLAPFVFAALGTIKVLKPLEKKRA